MKFKTFFSIIFIIGFVLIPNSQKACTEGLADGEATIDGRPIHWKVRMWYGMNRLLFWDNDTNSDGIPDQDNDGDGKPDLYPFIGVRSNTNEYPNYHNCMMGVNSAGFSIGITVVYTVTKGNTDPLMMHPLGNFSKTNEFYNYLQTFPGIYDDEYSEWEIGNNYGVADKYGNCAEFEYARTAEKKGHYREYNTKNAKRTTVIARNDTINLKNIVARSNFFHRKNVSGEKTNLTKLDNTSYRYIAAVSTMDKLRANNSLSVLTLLQGVYTEYEDYYGITIRRNVISRQNSNCSTMLIHGVKDDEDPRMTTMWTILGNADFSIAVPVWVLGVVYDKNKKPPYNLETEIYKDNIAHYAAELQQKYNLIKYHEIQIYTLPFEKHIIKNITEIILPEWRLQNWDDSVVVAKIGIEMNRIQNQISKDVFTYIKYIYSQKDEEYKYAPKIKISIFKIEKLNVNFTINAKIKKIKKVEWNYGDGTFGTSSEYTYKQKGKYLVSCTITDFYDNTQTAWCYINI